ncbi:carcinoembryonic antigen-related cell adhesion molecule 18-like [Hippopotamus amphibius kiboko]|uniref:carcinoembryonic antigen-related cell adhesion molecule 18-like n=1 Tax=Hippopotamus amphibius kiboko TaxID=575201 RepID=UPI002595AFBE|nr:carcinoembryonic antigen-related cell adhesion molecule 18-like [Hippopotamus amphibius kiboko]
MDLSRPMCRLWRELVLVASLLACGIYQASSQMYIAPDSLIGVETYSSRLVIENAPEDTQEYSWHRGPDDTEGNMILSYNTTSHSQQYGPMYSGRERVSSTGTLQIRRLQLNDVGNYTMRLDTINGIQRATGWLRIRELQIPQISVNTTSAVEDVDSVAATCYTNDSHIKWYVNYVQVSSNNRMTILPDNKTLIIQRFGRFDSPLQCGIEILPPEIIQKSELISVTVAYGPYDMLLRTSPTDFSGVLCAEIGSQVEMECIAYSIPESKYRWLHNGSLLSFSEKNITLPSLTWDQMGRYRCTVENAITQLTLYDEVQVQVPYPLGCFKMGKGERCQGRWASDCFAQKFHHLRILGGISHHSDNSGLCPVLSSQPPLENMKSHSSPEATTTFTLSLDNQKHYTGPMGAKIALGEDHGSRCEKRQCHGEDGDGGYDNDSGGNRKNSGDTGHRVYEQR